MIEIHATIYKYIGALGDWKVVFGTLDVDKRFDRLYCFWIVVT